MRRAMPEISEEAASLKEQMQRERHPLKKQRLHLLYLVASGQVTQRQQGAALLGIDRNTVGRWLATYEQEGLAGLLVVTPAPGATPTLNAAQQAQLQAALADPSGFESYKAVQQWLEDTLGVRMNYPAVHKLVRYKLGAKLKVPRPSHLKKTNKP